MIEERIILQAGALTVAILPLGAIMQDVRLNGVPHSLTLGSDKLEDYRSAMRHHGSLIGPVVNRLTGATADIGGIAYRFEANQDGRHTLHSGGAGTHLKVWQVESACPTEAVLSLDLPDGEGGFPGNRRITVRFSVHSQSTLRMSIEATTDRLTLMNIANHSYWNLDGSPCWEGHTLRIAADRYLPTTDDFTPTGEIRDVADTPYDFRTGRRVGVGSPPLDTCFCLSDARVGLRDVLTLTGVSGIEMTVATTEPGIQVYDGRSARRPGHAAYEGLALEAQAWPDAPNHAGFPSIDLAPGERYEQVTEWRFRA